MCRRGRTIYRSVLEINLKVIACVLHIKIKVITGQGHIRLSILFQNGAHRMGVIGKNEIEKQEFVYAIIFLFKFSRLHCC